MNKILLIILKTTIGAIVALSVIALIVSVFIFVGPYVQTFLPLMAKGILAFVICTPFIMGLGHQAYKLGDLLLKGKLDE